MLLTVAMVFAVAEYQLALAAIPTSIATVLAARYAYMATRTAAPAVKKAAEEMEPRITDVENLTEGWKKILDAKDQQLAYWMEEAKRRQAGWDAERVIAEQFAMKSDLLEKQNRQHQGTVESLQMQLDRALSSEPPVAE